MGLFTHLLSFNRLARNDSGFAPWRVRPQYKISIVRVKFCVYVLVIELLKATSNLIRQWIIKKERGIISICDSIWLGTNSIKLTRYGGELAKGRNWQLPLGAIYPCAQQFSESVARGKL